MLVIDNCYKSLLPFYTNISCFNGRNHTLNNMKLSNIVDWIAFCFSLQIYQQSLKDGKHLNAVIALLEQISRLISTFNNKKIYQNQSGSTTEHSKRIIFVLCSFWKPTWKEQLYKKISSRLTVLHQRHFRADRQNFIQSWGCESWIHQLRCCW